MHLNHLSYCFSIDNAHFRVSMLSDGVINFVSQDTVMQRAVMRFTASQMAMEAFF